MQVLSRCLFGAKRFYFHVTVDLLSPETDLLNAILSLHKSVSSTAIQAGERYVSNGYRNVAHAKLCLKISSRYPMFLS